MLLKARKFFGHLISKAIFQSQAYNIERKQSIFKDSKNIQQKYSSTADLNINNFQVDSTGRAKIDLTEYSVRTDLNYNNSESKIIINVYGRRDCYERHTEELIKQAELYKEHNIKVVGLNFRNIMKSKGKVTSQQDWIDDIVAVVDYYAKEHNIKLSNILLSGHSMGAAFATLAAAQIYQREKEKTSVKLINDRSFQNLPSIAVRLVFGNLGSGIFVGSILAGLSLVTCVFFGFYGLLIAAAVFASCVLASKIYPKIILKACEIIANIILYPTFGLMNAAAAFKMLPVFSKEYVFVKDDPIIARESGLAYDPEIRKIRRKGKTSPSPDDLMFVRSSQHRFVADETRPQSVQDLTSQQDNLQPDKKGLSKIKSRSTHDLPLFALRTSCKKVSSISGADVYDGMVRRLLGLG